MVKKLALHLALIFFTFLLLAMSSEVGSTMPKSITFEEAINIAKNEATKMGFKPEEMTVSADQNNTEWQQSFKNNELFWAKEGISGKIKGKDYWAINFSPKSPRREFELAGDLWVFVDKKNGSVIAVKASQ